AGAEHEFSLGKLTIEDGQVAISDQQNRRPRSVYDHISLTLENFAPDKPFSVDAAVHLPGSGAEKISLQGQGGPIAQNNFGLTPLFMSGTVNAKPTPAQLDLNLKANNISIAEAARLAAATGVAFAPGTTVNGRVNADIQARGPADKPALSGTIAGRDVQITGKDIPQPVQVKSVNLALTPSEIRSDNFNVTSGNTTVAARFALRQYTSKSPLIDATLQAPKAALPEVLAIAKAYGVSGLDKINGSGILNLDMHAVGPMQAIASNEILRALNGKLDVNFNNVRLAGTDITHQLASLGQFLRPGEKDQGFTNISRVTGNVFVRNGIAQTNDLQ